MDKFYEISTDTYTPNSHENQYLFERYDQITNFITLYIAPDKKFILAKPIKNEYQIEWYSPFGGLKDVRENKELANYAYSVYFEVSSIIEGKIKELEHSIDLDKKTWANILAMVFNSEDNLIFSNGKEISIVWGWKFNNNQIFKPDFKHIERDKGAKADHEVDLSIDLETPEKDQPRESENIQINNEEPVDQEEQIDAEEYVVEELMPQDIEEEQPEVESLGNGFLNFLKWFAGKYWWILAVLLLLIALVFTFKSF